MSTKDPNMKVIIGADTSDFDKGAKSVKQGLKDLDKTGTQAMSALGDAFGVNTGKVGQITSALTGLGQKLSQCGSAGVAAFGSVLKSITPIGGAIAGLGITAAIAGFKQLKAEADNFKSTIDGMNMSMATAAYISTYKQALHDVNSDTGRAVAEAMSGRRYVMVTGRSDYPNQINNVLGFPYLFRGALDVRATTINYAMKVAAAKALAHLARQAVPDDVKILYPGERLEFGDGYIIPKPFDRRLLVEVSAAVAEAAVASGVSRAPRDIAEYRRHLASL